MSHASLILGYVFDTKELVTASTIEVLTPKELENTLRRGTIHLDLEWYTHRHTLEMVDLRAGYYGVPGEKSPDEFVRSQRFVVGTCLADIDTPNGVLPVRRILEPVDKNLITEVVMEFGKAFPRKEWKADDLLEMLVTEMYSRSIRNRRSDYPIITFES